MNNNNFKALFQVLSSEQQILMRTDQKAFTLLSILGVFMVFFIIHFFKDSNGLDEVYPGHCLFCSQHFWQSYIWCL